MGSIDSVFIEGEIIAVEGQRVSAHLNSRHKLRSGDVLRIRRGHHYLGTLTVQHVADYLVIGTCNMESPDEPPRCGDIVYENSDTARKPICPPSNPS